MSTYDLCQWKDIAKHLGIHVRTAQRYKKKLRLPVYRLGGRVVSNKAELDTWANKMMGHVVLANDGRRYSEAVPAIDSSILDAEDSGDEFPKGKVPDSRTNNESKIYCADMTQLIAADSYISGLTTGFTEPMAASAFEYLTTILCNDTLVYFEKPESLRLRTPVVRAWRRASLEKQVHKQIQMAAAPALDLVERHKVISALFSEWLKGQRYLQASGLNNAQLLVKWTQYHLEVDDLQEQYWNNNNTDQMLEALDMFLTDQSRTGISYKEITKTLSRYPLTLSAQARAEWGTRPVIDFYLAWGYWSFLKGYRYLHKIPKQGVYVCHWSREDTSVQGVSYATVHEGGNFTRGLFPWGTVLSEFVRLPELNRSANAVFTIIKKLREYTRRNVHAIAPLGGAGSNPHLLRRNTLAFLNAGLAKVGPRKWEQNLQKNKHLQNMVLTHFVQQPRQLDQDSAILRTRLDFAINESATETKTVEMLVALDRYRETSEMFFARHQSVFEAFWNERGWI